MKKYSYKDSGIEWLGEIPEHWKVDRIKDKTTNIIGGDWGDDPTSDKDGKVVVVLRVADLDDIYFSYDDPTYRKISDTSWKSRKVDNRTLLIEKSGGGEKQNVGRVGFPKNLSEEAICSNFMALIKLEETVDIRFVNYMFNNLYNNDLNYPFVQQTTGIQNLNVGYYLTTKIPLPPLPEQKAIADYLDTACQKIDRVIELKEKQIETMQSHLASKFHEVLTKGIGNEELKESKINWMGDMPKSWERKRLKDILHLKSGDGITSTEISPEGKYPVYGGNGLRGYTDSFTHEGYFPLIGRQGALCGNINYADGKFWASEHAVVATPTRKINVYWVGELMKVMNLNQYSNAAAQPGLAVEKIKNLYIPYPEFEEQNEIADYLEGYEEKTKRSVSIIEDQITVLKNYRKSLIHECITGKKRVFEGEVPVEAEVV